MAFPLQRCGKVVPTVCPTPDCWPVPRYTLSVNELLAKARVKREGSQHHQKLAMQLGSWWFGWIFRSTHGTRPIRNRYLISWDIVVQFGNNHDLRCTIRWFWLFAWGWEGETNSNWKPDSFKSSSCCGCSPAGRYHCLCVLYRLDRLV